MYWFTSTEYLNTMLSCTWPQGAVNLYNHPVDLHIYNRVLINFLRLCHIWTVLHFCLYFLASLTNINVVHSHYIAFVYMFVKIICFLNIYIDQEGLSRSLTSLLVNVLRGVHLFSSKLVPVTELWRFTTNIANNRAWRVPYEY